MAGSPGELKDWPSPQAGINPVPTAKPPVLSKQDPGNSFLVSVLLSVEVSVVEGCSALET